MGCQSKPLCDYPMKISFQSHLGTITHSKQTTCGFSNHLNKFSSFKDQKDAIISMDVISPLSVKLVL